MSQNRSDMDFQASLEAAFIIESEDIFEAIESDILEIEKKPDNEELKKNVLRGIHTLKGSSGMVNEIIPIYVHTYESIVKALLQENVPTEQNCSFILKELDYIKELVRVLIREKDEIDQGEFDKRIARLKDFDTNKEIEKSKNANRKGEQQGQIVELQGHSVDQAVKEPANDKFGFFMEEEKEAVIVDSDYPLVYKISFSLEELRFAHSWKPEDIIADLRAMGNVIQINCQKRTDVDWETMDCHQCYLKWVVILETRESLKSIDDIFLFFKENNTVKIELTDSEEVTKLGEILITEGKIKDEDLERALKEEQKIGERLVKSQKVTSEDINEALKVQTKLRKTLGPDDQLKVATKKVNHLIDLVGELIISNSNLTTIQKDIKNEELDHIQFTINKISKQLRDVILSLKMVPIGQLLTKYFRMVRDLSKDMGKNVELLLEGENTELDKTMFDILQEPLLHLLRNSVDHGIESKEERQARKKDETGTITIRAFHESGKVFIEIEDDGRGLDRDKILKKAIDRELLKPDTEYTDDEIYNVIFESGFSTKTQTTLVSGRGVGMDAVMTGIKKLNGSIKIKNRPGKGTTFSIQLPLTLAIIEGFLVRVGINHFVIPLSFVSECFEIERELVEAGGKAYNLRGEYLKIIKLNEVFSNIEYEKKGDDEESAKVDVMVIQQEKHKIGILIDEIIGDIQAVIKPLVSVINRSGLITGTTLLGDGEIALIIDVVNLFEKFNI